MNSFITPLIGLLKLRAGPQHMPASRGLTLLMVGAYIGQGILTGQHFGEPNSAGRIILALVVQVLALIILLRLRQFPERFFQSLLALTSTGVVLGLLYFVVQLQNDPDVPVQPFWALVVISLFFWNIAVDANIYRHTLAVSFSTGILATVGVFAATYVFDYMVFFQA